MLASIRNGLYHGLHGSRDVDNRYIPMFFF